MRTKKEPRLHLEIQKYGEKYLGLLRTTFREGSKIKHTTHGNIKLVFFFKKKTRLKNAPLLSCILLHEPLAKVIK